MIVSTYNNAGLDDVLLVMLKESEVSDQEYQRNGNVTEITQKNSQEVVAYNFFQASQLVGELENGPVNLSKEQIERLNEAIQLAGFEQSLTVDESPKFVVGFVKECKPHEDSDHLNVTQTEIDNGEVVQIVCGASNIAQGQKVVVAKVGAILPDGLVIWPGELRGKKSNGMICSARELGIESEQTKGILVLGKEQNVGAEFEF